MPELLKFHVEGHIATVTFDHPPLNLIIPQLYDEVIETFDKINNDEQIKVVILTGAGRAFCAGGDVKGFVKRTRETIEAIGRHSHAGFAAVYDCAVPVIGAINGYALGGGMAFAAACDIIIASERAVFGLPEIDVGALGSIRYLSRLVSNEYKARRLALTAKKISAQELAQFGSIEQVVAHDQLMPTAMKLAQEIAGKSGVALRLYKESLNKTEKMAVKESYLIEMTYLIKLFDLIGTKDGRELQRAFLEKRPPSLET